MFYESAFKSSPRLSEVEQWTCISISNDVEIVRPGSGLAIAAKRESVRLQVKNVDAGSPCFSLDGCDGILG